MRFLLPYLLLISVATTATLSGVFATQSETTLALRASAPTSASSSPPSHISSPGLVDQGPENLQHGAQNEHGRMPRYQDTHRYRPSSPPPSSAHTTQTFSPPRRPARRQRQGHPGASSSQAPSRAVGRHGASTSGAAVTVSPPRWRFHPPDPSDITRVFGPAPVHNPNTAANLAQHRPSHPASAANRPASSNIIITPRPRPSTGARIAKGLKKGASKLGGCLTGKGLDCT